MTSKKAESRGKGERLADISIYYKNISWSPALGLDCADSGYVIRISHLPVHGVYIPVNKPDINLQI